MATILQRLTRALSPTVIREIAKTAALEPELARRGMAAAAPLVILALADKAALRSGPSTVFQMLPACGAPMLGQLAFIARAGVPMSVLAPVLGARAGAVGNTLDDALGFRASSLLAVTTAIILGLIARVVEEQELDEVGLAEFLAVEATEYRTADTLTAVREALETISRMSPSQAPRFRRLVADVASCVRTTRRQ